MNLKTAADQFDSFKSSMGIQISKSLKTIWELLNYDLIENIFAPRRRVFVAMDKGGISVAYGSRFFGKSQIHVCRKYAYDRKSQESVSRKYIYQDGQIPKPELVVSTLDYFVGEFKAQHAKVILAIPKAWTVYRTVEFPAAVLENLHEVISYELDRLLSLNPENAYFDFKIVSKNQDGLKVAIAAARKDLIDSYIRPIEDKGLTVEKVTTSLSVAGGLLNHFYGRQSFLLLEVNKDEYDVSGIGAGTVLFAHREKFNEDSSENRIECLSEDLKSLCNDLRQDGQSVQVVLCSDEENYESLQAKIDVPLLVMRKSNLSLDYKGETREADFLSASGCLELLTGNRTSINLISKNNKTISNQAFRFSIILAVAALSLGMISLFAPLVLETVRIYEIEHRMNLLKDDFRKYEPQKNELDTILHQIRATNEFKNSKPPRILLLRELSDILPSQFWISRMTITEKTVEFEVRGNGTQGDIVPLFEASPYFENVRRVTPSEADAEKDQSSHSNVFMMDIVGRQAAQENRK